MTNQPRDPLHAWPIIDGPLQGQNWAHSDDYFYAAELVVTGLSQPGRDPDPKAGTARAEYRLRQLEAGGYAWSCKGE